ncbi:MAG TPA: selenocysteine-specific translation elongation factor [Thermomicrobiales bacterium]|nr:selenocysteine-specific translation elongation factor [Thermomicrobiales bacterium]
MTRPVANDGQIATMPPARPFVIGTAGHVDHGKSTLVKALTGIDPDRLAEEKARAMTIDLGFAWLTLPSGQSVSVVDVPGHERFIKNMLAGIGGIDAALLVVAADEGPMPQTVEHLAILDLLGVERGVIVLTKADVAETDWLDLVREDVRELVSTTALADAPIVAVSALSGQGLPALLETLEGVLASAPGTDGGSTPRLPIDRVFSVSGFGTVVTGTLSGGEINTGDELRLYPGHRRARVRGLQSHQEKVSRALPGRRTAVNLSGIATEEVRRGDVLAPPGIMSPSQRLDVRLRLLPDAPVALKQNDEVDFFTGAAELPARVTLLDRERLDPGERAWVQLRFREPIAVLKNDRFIVRRPSPSETLGGGEIVDPNPPRHRRFRPETVAALETLAAGAPGEILLQALAQRPIEIKELVAGAAGLPPEQVDEALAELIADGEVVLLGGSERSPAATDFAVASSLLESLTLQIAEALRSYHASQPLRPGLAREEARRRLGITQPRLFDDLVTTLASAGELIDDGATLRLPEFRITLDPVRRAAADEYLAAIRAQPFTPPGPHEHGLDPETLAALEHLREVTKIAEGVYFAPEAWNALVQGTLALIDSNGSITLSQFRDHFGTSRKYAQAALEYLDQLKYTRRVGDDRVRGPRRPGVK